nr:hypothetical protein [Actinoplanes polyasparticus]
MANGYCLAWFPDKEGEKRKTHVVLHGKDGSSVELSEDQFYGQPYLD